MSSNSNKTLQTPTKVNFFGRKHQHKSTKAMRSGRIFRNISSQNMDCKTAACQKKKHLQTLAGSPGCSSILFMFTGHPMSTPSLDAQASHMVSHLSMRLHGCSYMFLFNNLYRQVQTGHGEHQTHLSLNTVFVAASQCHC